MELEELMTNRSLLEKMSEDDSIRTNGYRKSSKQVVIQENHSMHNHVKPKDLRIEYKNNSNGGPAVQSTVQVQNDAVVLEGYGCQCPKRFVKTIKIFWTLFLILYAFGIPVVFYHLYTKLAVTKERIQRLENDFDSHLMLISTGEIHIAASKQTSKSIVDVEKSPVNQLLKKPYIEFTEFRLRTDKVVAEINDKIKLFEQRLKLLYHLEHRSNVTTPLAGRCKCTTPMNGVNTTSCSSFCDSISNTPKSIYTRWGKSTCPDNINTTTVYHGYIGSSFHTHQGGGSNYLCLPSKPSYHKIDTHSNIDNRGYIHGVEFELGDSNIFDTKVTSGQYFDAFCSVCETKNKHNSIMIPGTTNCPDGWKQEYYGYLMAQKKYLKRTEFICVDHQPDLTVGTEEWGKGAFLHFIETRCGVLPCRKGMYQDYLETTCVLCSK